MSHADLVADLRNCEEKALRGRITRDDTRAAPDVRTIAALQASCYSALAAIKRAQLSAATRRSRP